MNDSINKYLNSSKENLNTILLNLETNIEFTENDLWKDSKEFEEIIKNITNIYFDKYYLYTSNDFKIIDKYIKFNTKINRKLKTILLSIIDYYKSKGLGNIVREKENSILYLTILIYIGLTLYDKEYYTIDTPKKIEKVINNIIDYFQNIRFKKDKDLVTLINNIKDIVLKNNKFNDLINDLSNNKIKNYFIKVNDKINLYKVMFEYKIDELDDYEYLDIDIVNKNMNISSKLSNISYDLLYFTSFKLLKKGDNKELLFKIKKDDLISEENRKFMLDRNNIVNSKIKFLIDYEEIINDYDFINMINENKINIYIEVNNVFETNNYNMFMDVKNIIVPEEFLSINEKYVEIWKDMNMNFIIKNLKYRIDENNLINRK